MKKRCDALVPSARSLLEPLQGPREQAHMIRRRLINEPSRLLTEHLFLKMPMKKSIRNIHLVHRPGARNRQLKNSPNRAGFDNGGESVGEVNTCSLTKTPNDPTSLVSVKSTIRMKLVLEHPLPGNDVGPRRTGDELPSVIALQCVKFLLHRGEPHGITKRGTGGGRQG